MQDVIGKKFKRNVYGFSIWTDIVVSVFVVWEYHYREHQYCKAEIWIKGLRGQSYPISEIVFL